MERMSNKKSNLTPALIEQFATKLSKAKIGKPLEVKANGNRVKVVLKKENEYHVYLDGQFITTDMDLNRTVELVRVLLAE
jgi:hypothetical protein